MRGGKKFSRFVYRRMEIGTLASSVIEHFATSYFNPVLLLIHGFLYDFFFSFFNEYYNRDLERKVWSQSGTGVYSRQRQLETIIRAVPLV